MVTARESRYQSPPLGSLVAVTLDNSGDDLLRVPGVGHSIGLELPAARRFAHGFVEWSQDRLTAREMAMLQLMSDLTDRPGWHADVNDAGVVLQWEREALARPLISLRAFCWCLSELRDKAKQLAATGVVTVFNAGVRLAKSDTLLSRPLVDRLAAEVDELAQRHRAPGHRQPSQQQPTLVDPRRCPLVYGQTRVLAHGGRVGLEDAVEAVGRGSMTFRQNHMGSGPMPMPMWGRAREGMRFVGRGGTDRYGVSKDFRRFSPLVQWLPCEVAFVPDGAATEGEPRVRISSYINNLHPTWYRSLYRTIEQVLDASIEPWNEVLVRPARDRDPPRIRTYGVAWEPEPPAWAADLETVEQDRDSEAYRAAYNRVCAYLVQPDNPLAPPPRGREEHLGRPDWHATLSLQEAVRLKHRRIRKWLHPEPGVAYTYEDWKAGKTNGAVVPGVAPGGKKPLPPKPDHEYYAISLRDEFREQGLQVIVEIGSVELRPGASASADEPRWQLSGALNEHIVATSMVFFGSENVTAASCALRFRVEADVHPSEHVFGHRLSRPHHAQAPLADVYGVADRRGLGSNDPYGAGGGLAVQVLGAVSTPDGRLVAFPNTVQHQMQPGRLADATQPGRRRFLQLHLVDPHYRICSTRNVPPQQPDWWAAAGWGRIDWAARHMPPEMVAMVRKHVFPPATLRATAADATMRDTAAADRQRILENVGEDICFYCFGPWAETSVRPAVRVVSIRT